jgi:hypothetical protein
LLDELGSVIPEGNDISSVDGLKSSNKLRIVCQLRVAIYSTDWAIKLWHREMQTAGAWTLSAHRASHGYCMDCLDRQRKRR